MQTGQIDSMIWRRKNRVIQGSSFNNFNYFVIFTQEAWGNASKLCVWLCFLFQMGGGWQPTGNWWYHRIMSWDVFFNENPGKTGRFASKIGWSLQAVNLPVATCWKRLPNKFHPISSHLQEFRKNTCIDKIGIGDFWWFTQMSQQMVFFRAMDVLASQKETRSQSRSWRNSLPEREKVCPCKAFTGASKMLEMMGPWWWAN